jgi:hypothetical protein
MQNYDALEKSRGIVAFATNTDTTDYVSIANKTVKLASKKLSLPYTIITKNQIKPHTVNNSRFDRDSEQFVQWKNFGRHSAYDLSPYDETLVIDVDYIVQDTALANVFETNFDYLLMRSARNINNEPADIFMGNHSLPYVWATVFAFRKTEKTKMFFDLIDRIQNNYAYYRDIFNIEARNYRNDYAFAMADLIINGFVIDSRSIPGPMLNIPQTITQIKQHGDLVVVKDQDRSYVIPKMNMHVMSKAYLQSKDFERFINELA